ncbi:MAG: M56 family metallopeptidase [Saprospiraceae bacterium]
MGFAMYLLKANIILSVLFGAYWLLLKNERFFQLNRFILMGSLLAALLGPLLPEWSATGVQSPFLGQVHEKITAINPMAPVFQVNEPQASTKTPTAIDGTGIQTLPATPAASGSIFLIGVTCLYLAVAIVLFLSFLFQLLKLFAIQYERDRLTQKGFMLIEHDRDIPPFSFFKLLVINPNQFDAPKLEQVIAHEKVHIRQWHSIDILFVELSCMLCWFNPLLWLFRRYTKLNLEYIADEAVLDTGIDKKAYQYHLLYTSLKPSKYRLSNLFHSSPIKLRIKMMNTNKFSPLGLLKYGLIVPLLVGLYFMIQPQQVQAQTVSVVSGTTTTSNAAAQNDENIYIIFNSGITKDVLNEVISELKSRNVFVNVKNKNFNDGALTAIDVEIEVPGSFSSRLSSEGDKMAFTPLVFVYETDKGQTLSFTKGIPDKVSDKGRKLLTQNLMSGLSIVRRNGGMHTIGVIHLD